MVQLSEIRSTVRRMTARYSQAQMPDAQIDRYINLAYTLHFPEQFKNLKLTKPYVFTTIPNVDTYDFPYQNNLPQSAALTVSVPTGSIGLSLASPWQINNIFSLHVPPVIPPANSLIIPGSVTITIQAGPDIVFTDLGNGILISTTAGNSGTIDYNSGQATLTHTAGAGVATTTSFSYSLEKNSAQLQEGNISIGAPVYCQGYLLRYYQDKTTFYNRWPKLSVNQQIGVGDNTGGPFAGIIPSTPFYRAQLDIFGNVTEAGVIISAFDNTGFSYTLTDTPQPGTNIGLLLDGLQTTVGTVNYLTGAYSFVPANSSIIPSTATIYAAVVPYQSSRPTDVLFYNQQIVFRPCPQQVFQVEFQISQQPTDLLTDTDAPELDEWYLGICAIAAKLIYTDFPDAEGMAYLMPIYQEQIQMMQRRTLRQMSSQRAATIFSQPGRPLGGYFFGTEYSGS